MTSLHAHDVAQWASHVGRTQMRRQRLDEASLRRFAAATGAGSDLSADPPPLGLWAWFLETVPDDELGADGHPRRGAFLPPITLPRRMFAAATFRFERPLLLDQTAEMEVRIADLQHKSGRTGDLIFVTVDRTVSQGALLRVTERQTLVYRGAGEAPPLPAPAADAEDVPDGGELWWPQSVHLFRFSAATFNSHRIHYDEPYATGVEGYPGLVVQGPFTAAKLAMLAARDGELAGFEFRAQAPLFAGRPIRLEKVGPGEFQARRCDGTIAVRATTTYK